MDALREQQVNAIEILLVILISIKIENGKIMDDKC